MKIMIKGNILFGVLRIFILMVLLGSCSLKEETTPSRLGVVEFIARHTDFNGRIVGTKATSVSDFEDKIHNCYFLLFDNNGALAYKSDNLVAEDGTVPADPLRFNKMQLADLDSYTNSTACFIANVSKNVVADITTLDGLNATVLEIAYSGVNVMDTENANRNSFFVVPDFDLDGDANTESVQCIPMFGMDTCNLKTTDQCQISLKRLFAKITVKISVTQNYSTFDLLAAHLYNLPTKVKLTEPDNPTSYESEWVREASAFLPPDIEGPITEDQIGGLISSGTYDFYLYVPEYFLQPLESSINEYGEDEKYKPLMYDNSSDNPQYPIYIRLFGTYEDSNGTITGDDDAEYNTTYDLFLGENETTNFTLRRNTHYTNNITINGVKNSIAGSSETETLDCRVEITKEHNEVIMLGQTANCYIIGKVGTYIYPACKGVFKGGINSIPAHLKCTKGTDLEILAQDNSSIKIDNLTYNQESGEFSFEVSTLDGGTGLVSSNDGNVILGLTYMENGVKNVEWSWHIWICSGSEWAIDAYEVETQPYPNGREVMDRNLGANPTSLQNTGAAVGLYYRYGQREPYIKDVRTGLITTDKSDYYGYNNVSTDWGGADKAQTDPCPPGYRVPAKSVWEHPSQTPVALNNTTYNAFEYWDEVYYPYSGYLDSNNQLKNHITSAYTYTGTYTDEITYLGTKYKNIKYSIYLDYTAGTLLGSDKTLIYEGIQQSGALNDMKIISCQRYIWKFSWTTGGYYVLEDYTPSGTLENALVEGVKTQIESTLTNLLRTLSTIDTNPSYGYQVRCVKE